MQRQMALLAEINRLTALLQGQIEPRSSMAELVQQDCFGSLCARGNDFSVITDADGSKYQAAAIPPQVE